MLRKLFHTSRKKVICSPTAAVIWQLLNGHLPPNPRWTDTSLCHEGGSWKSIKKVLWLFLNGYLCLFSSKLIYMHIYSCFFKKMEKVSNWPLLGISDVVWTKNLGESWFSKLWSQYLIGRLLWKRQMSCRYYYFSLLCKAVSSLILKSGILLSIYSEDVSFSWQISLLFTLNDLL